MVRNILWAAAAITLLPSVGCGGSPCDGAETRAVPLSELPCNMTNAGGVWESHPLPPLADECRWFEFRACSEYQFEHPLGEIPSTVIGYTSFESDGRFSTIGSGNSFVVDEVSESEIVIRNAQNQLFWLRLVVQ